MAHELKRVWSQIFKDKNPYSSETHQVALCSLGQLIPKFEVDSQVSLDLGFLLSRQAITDNHFYLRACSYHVFFAVNMVTRRELLGTRPVA